MPKKPAPRPKARPEREKPVKIPGTFDQLIRQSLNTPKPKAKQGK